jgi:capping protein (actin filament) muscle Z-line, beta
MKQAPKVSYKVISTVMLTIGIESPAVGKLEISGSSSKQSSDTVTMPENFGPGMDGDLFHINNIGKMLENNEDRLRTEIADIYVSKQRQITNTGRLIEEFMTHDQRQKYAMDMAANAKAGTVKEEIYR